MSPTRKFISSPLALTLRSALCASLLVAAGCQSDASDVSPDDARQGELAALEGAMVEIVPSAALEGDQFEAVARWLEAQTKAHMVKVQVRKDAGGPDRLEVEIWGDTALPESLDVDLRAAFPALADAEITQARLQGPPPEGEGHGVKVEGPAPDEDPEAAKARIIEEMRARGVEGDIVVDIVDGPEGERHVEVNVKQEGGSPE